MLYQFVNEFTVSVALSVITMLITETKGKSKVKSTKTTKKLHLSSKNKNDFEDEEDDEIVLELSAGNTDGDDYEKNDELEEEDDELYSHLKNFINLMSALDDAIEEVASEDQRAETQAMYEKFGTYYQTIVPYAELINTSSQMMFPDELRRNLDRFNDLVHQFINDIIGDIYAEDSISTGVQLKYELDEINRLANSRLEEWSGRPTFESVIDKTTDDSSDETQAE